MTDPNIVVDAIIDSNGTKTDNNVNIFPCTIRRYALLEKLNSPFIDPTAKFDINSIIPSAYVFATSKEDLKKYTTKDIDLLINDSFDWAESLTINDIPQMIQVITQQITNLNKAAPSGGPGDKQVSDGSKKN